MNKISTNKAPSAIGPYSQAVVHAGLVYTSGQIAINPETGNVEAKDIVGQTEQVMKNLGAVLEAMALESYKSVVPTYYEVALKGRYLEDSDSWRMLDMIYENVKVDAGVLYTKNIESVHQAPRDMVLNGRNTVSSQMKKISTRVQNVLLPKLLDNLLALEK